MVKWDSHYHIPAPPGIFTSLFPSADEKQCSNKWHFYRIYCLRTQTACTITSPCGESKAAEDVTIRAPCLLWTALILEDLTDFQKILSWSNKSCELGKTFLRLFFLIQTTVIHGQSPRGSVRCLPWQLCIKRVRENEKYPWISIHPNILYFP